jgi:hypothetical protein
MKLEIPESLRLREEAICTALRQASDSGGETGDLAELLEAILLPHLAKEKIDVLQPLRVAPAQSRATERGLGRSDASGRSNHDRRESSRAKA